MKRAISLHMPNLHIVSADTVMPGLETADEKRTPLLILHAPRGAEK
jgi:hypothetical protein